MMRAAAIVLAAVSVFAFPWPLAAVLIFIASLYLPAVGISLGILYDVLYYAHGAGWPWGTILGALGSIAAYFLAGFLRSRVSDISL
jgi:hypothetical protein